MRPRARLRMMNWMRSSRESRHMRTSTILLIKLELIPGWSTRLCLEGLEAIPNPYAQPYSMRHRAGSAATVWGVVVGGAVIPRVHSV
jgi:hypothetical protein